MTAQDPNWRDEDLLAWLLDRERQAEDSLASFEGDSQTRERLEDLDGFLTECRSELREESRAAGDGHEDLQQRILASTTREDVSWRGDLGVFGGFLRHRLHASVLLRVVAASLLIHVAALPVLAYFGWVAPEPTTHIGFEFPKDLPYREAEPEPEFADLSEELDSAQEEAALDSLLDGGHADELYRGHLRRFGLTELAAQAGELPADTVIWANDLGLVLRAEVLLNELGAVPEGRPYARSAHLDFVVSELEACLLRLGSSELKPALRRLAASAWLRAHSMGRAQAVAELESRCPNWVSEGLQVGRFLKGEDWVSAFERALRETPVFPKLESLGY